MNVLDLCWKSICYAFETVLKTKPIMYVQNYVFKKYSRADYCVRAFNIFLTAVLEQVIALLYYRKFFSVKCE